MQPPPDRVPSGSTRRDPLWLIVLAVALLAARVATGMYESSHPVDRRDLVSWVPADFAEQASRESRKPILYNFGADWCVPCKVMDREVFAVEKHARAIDQLVVPVRVVDRSRETGRNSPLVDSLERALEVTSFPTLVIVANGKVVDRQQGYPGAAQTTQWLARASMSARSPDRSGRSFRLQLPSRRGMDVVDSTADQRGR